MADVRRIAGGSDAVVASGVAEVDLAKMPADTSDIRDRRLAEVGVAVGDEVQPSIFEAAKDFRRQTRTGAAIMTTLALLPGAGRGLCLAGPDQGRIPRPQCDRSLSSWCC